MLLLIFRYIFSGAIKSPSGGYTDFVVPAILLITVLIGSMTSAIGIAEDLRSGMIDRFRSLPMARSAVLTGRSLTDLVRNVISLAVMVGLGVAVGFRFHGNAGPILAGMLLILAFGYSFTWVNTAIGISAKDPESAQNAAAGPAFLLMFASNAIVPVSTLPGLAAAVRPQPAAERDRVGRPRALRGRRHRKRRLGVAGLVRGNHRGLLPDRLCPLPEGGGQVRAS
jgi:ABC transporter DrrB family efflux protein